MEYIAYFTGRNKGAIGIMQNFIVTVEAENKDNALLKLYDTHEHIINAVFIKHSESIET